MNLFDSHFHLDDEDNAEAIIERANDAGVQNLTLVSCNAKDVARNLKYAQKFEGLYTTSGVHPLYMDKFDGDYAPFIEALQSDEVKAVGEIGLDYYYDKEEETLKKQRATFRRFLELSAEFEKVAIIHCRDAFNDCYNDIKDVLKGQFPFIIHCYTGDSSWAEKFVALGGYISYSGICTFKNAQEIRDSLAVVPQERILVETDSPYLAPMPFRGKRNEPAYVQYVLEKVAEVCKVTPDKMAEITTANAKKAFKI